MRINENEIIRWERVINNTDFTQLAIKLNRVLEEKHDVHYSPVGIQSAMKALAHFCVKHDKPEATLDFIRCLRHHDHFEFSFVFPITNINYNMKDLYYGN